MIKRISSLLIYCTIQCNRFFDHTWRYFTGLPLARRSAITPHIYLGGQYAAHSIARLQQLGITAVVNMRTVSIHKKVNDLGIKILHLPTRDKFAPTIEQLIKGCKFIEEEIKNGGKVYIHCKFGEERGATMAIAYLIWTGLKYEDAFALVKKTRTFINPVPAQIARLRELEEEVKKTETNILANAPV